MSAWQELVSTALLGTERREPPTLAELGGLARDGGPEERLLSAAGVLAVSRRAGRRPLAAPVLPSPAPEETLPVCGPSVTGRLALILDDQRGLLGEWMRAVARKGLRAPAERLPDLLEAADADRSLRADLEPILGERGAWLAAQDPRWAWAAPLPVAEEKREALWATGELEQRRRLVALLRSEDPGQARDLVSASWAQESPEDRAAFIDLFATGLAPDDEPMLEAALDERRQEVRAAAARLLARLPGSAFGERMRARTLPLVRVEGGVRKRLKVDLPEELDDAAVRDGIVRKPPQGTGERAWWLQQLVVSTPLASWSEASLGPEQAATLRANDGLEEPVRAGFARAAASQRDAEWAAAFVTVEPKLAALVDPAQVERAAIEALRKGGTEIALQLPAPWPRALSEEAVKLLAELARRRTDWQTPRRLAERLDPELVGSVAERLESVDRVPSDETILTLLTFRREMHEELR